ncbi:modification methylase [Gallibacterium genomosp. 3]|uniref:Cytosine-specific methyltransferase n=1 Tax=Gallibacterium genomosp. 3 TaxID=505345 RepID=A0A1A7NYG4_9PAST|nr:DNA cytosine methyltransferase [Gallibacterium genomosp. 3]OBW94034.1 modification methylase [Gallibacterium genomosp. 3]
MKLASFFAGVGGIDLAFEQAGFHTIYANEISHTSCKTFEANFSLKVDNRDIKEVQPKEVPDTDVFLAGFPCQAFSVAGYRQGFEDEKGRGTLFFELLRLIKDKMPPIVFLENVKNLKSHDKGNTFKVIYEALSDLGYHISYEVLNAAKYGNVPQSRERIYIVGFLDQSKWEKFEFPNEIELTDSIHKYIDYDNKQDDRYYYTADKCKFYNELEKNMTSSDTLYQWRRQYVRENKNNLCPTLTANMGTGGHNVPLVKTKFGIRKLTPRECFNFQGFPKDFKIPDELSHGKLYEQAGNSVVVPVVKRIAENIKKACK